MYGSEKVNISVIERDIKNLELIKLEEVHKEIKGYDEELRAYIQQIKSDENLLRIWNRRELNSLGLKLLEAVLKVATKALKLEGSLQNV